MAKIESWNTEVPIQGPLGSVTGLPILQAYDIQVDDTGKRLDAELEEIKNNITNAGTGGGGTGDATSITVDSELSTTSENPVQNKVVNSEFDNVKREIGGIVSSFPRKLQRGVLDGELKTVLGVCGTDGSITQSTDRRITDYICVDGYSRFYTNDGETTFFIRCFDENKTFIGTLPTTNPVASINVLDILLMDNNVRYLVLCLRTGEEVPLYSEKIAIRGSLDDIYLKRNTNTPYVNVPLRTGYIESTYGYCVDRKEMINRSICSDMYEVEPDATYNANFTSREMAVFEYNETFGLIKKTIYTPENFNFTTTSETKYVMFRCYRTTDIFPENETLKITTRSYFTKIKKLPRLYNEEKLCFKIDDDKYSAGNIKLPQNYSVDGKPVPVIVFVHGSGDFGGFSDSAMTANYATQYGYLVDNGYAIIDFYGWDSSVSFYGTNTWCSPTNIKSYETGIKFMLDKYNLDENNIFVSGKSLGGIMGLYLALGNKINIKACGLLSPVLSTWGYNELGYNKTVRLQIARDFGFSDVENSPLNSDTFSWQDEATVNYIKEHSHLIAGYNPFWIGSNNGSVNDKLDADINGNYETLTFKFTNNTPLKIWCAEDDTVSVHAIDSMIDAIRNAGCHAEVRKMPANTGGHHAVDTDANALQKTDVTTKLNVHYDSIALAYYELVQFFEQFRSE